ncbi:MAG: hypothetical protein LBH25_11310 [Fibromonadaceae bacterium]|jgi:hypothetical protein|nr:hypothetical protein [Fibromonadaceae bacterium]
MSYDYKPMSSETPWSFREVIEVGDLKIEYNNMIEVCQGGPNIGNLYINGMEVKMPPRRKNYVNPLFFGDDLQFGGPLLIDKEYLYIPWFDRYVSRFRLFCWNLTNQTCIIGTEVLPLIILDKIDGNDLHYNVGNKISDKRVISISEIDNPKFSTKADFFSLQYINLLILLLMFLITGVCRKCSP